ncbi:gb [Venturia nashicola]|uniref:Chorismate mutase n=1 Tax=Venturia nashicola TaxID=86259 RepID=A0A4Z1PRZ7_9PEZI|nr:gb [Venturia nashicola]
MDSTVDLPHQGKAFDLANIRFQLIRLEDTITFHLIERAQFHLNPTIYQPNLLPIPSTTPPGADSASQHLSLLDYLLRETERIHSYVRRYDSPDEYPFFPSAIQKPILKPFKYPAKLHDNDVNVNAQLKDAYIYKILPAACRQTDALGDRGEEQENYGSSATCDVSCLQALSRRIHYGKFVAESKFRSETERFVKLIKEEDRQGIAEAITDAKVENKVLERLRLKAKTYGTDPEKGGNEQGKINVDAVVAMYKDHVIPLTKEVEVEYLMQRLAGTEWE